MSAIEIPNRITHLPTPGTIPNTYSSPDEPMVSLPATDRNLEVDEQFSLSRLCTLIDKEIASISNSKSGTTTLEGEENIHLDENDDTLFLNVGSENAYCPIAPLKYTPVPSTCHSSVSQPSTASTAAAKLSYNKFSLEYRRSVGIVTSKLRLCTTSYIGSTRPRRGSRLIKVIKNPEH